MHLVNGTLYACHTSCDHLDAGTFDSVLPTIKEWLDVNPYEVVTLLVVKSDYAEVGNYTELFRRAGLLDQVYLPPKITMELDDWPTLGEMIASGRRLVTMMDYKANQKVFLHPRRVFENVGNSFLAHQHQLSMHPAATPGTLS